MEKRVHTCTKCHGVMVAGVATKLGLFHKECFLCSHCRRALGGSKYLLVNQDPYCSNCYTELFEKKCHKCEAVISGHGDVILIVFDRRFWHQACFRCDKCDADLIGQLTVANSTSIVCTGCAPGVS